MEDGARRGEEPRVKQGGRQGENGRLKQGEQWKGKERGKKRVEGRSIRLTSRHAILVLPSPTRSKVVFG